MTISAAPTESCSCIDTTVALVPLVCAVSEHHARVPFTFLLVKSDHPHTTSRMRGIDGFSFGFGSGFWIVIFVCLAHLGSLYTLAFGQRTYHFRFRAPARPMDFNDAHRLWRSTR